MPDKMVLLVISGWLRGFDLVLSMRRNENENHSICGYYREFDTGDEASSRALAERVTLDMSRFREFCLGS